MKKIIIFIFVAAILTLSACGKDGSPSKSDNVQKSNNSQINDKVIIQAKENALKYFPSNFKEALAIETKRQEILLTGCRADMGNATYDAFISMKSLYNSYCGKVNSKLDDTQKKAFEVFLQKEKEYNIDFDMFTFKVISQQVFTTGNGDCSEDYNLMRTQTVRMYCYYLQLTDNPSDSSELKNILQEQFDDYMFFNNTSKLEGKSLSELSSISTQYSPLLRSVLNSTSQVVFDDYKTTFDIYISAMQKFEDSIGIKSESCNSYAYCSKLNTAIICNLYSVLKDMEYPEGMFDEFNYEVNKDKYLLRWK